MRFLQHGIYLRKAFIRIFSQLLLFLPNANSGWKDRFAGSKEQGKGADCTVKNLG